MSDAELTTRAVLLAVKRQTIKAYLSRLDVKTAAAYELHVWAYMREFFTSGDAFAFLDSMANEIENQFTRAWNEGAREMGVEPGDMSEDDLLILEDLIVTEQNFLDGIAGDIEEYIAEGGHTDAEFNARFRARAGLWANGYNSMVTQAKLHFGDRDKLEWVLGATEQHCETGQNGRPGIGCKDLAGMVLYAREWVEAGVKPQSSSTNCGGWECQCELRPTTKRRTPDGLGRLLDMMTAANV